MTNCLPIAAAVSLLGLTAPTWHSVPARAGTSGSGSECRPGERTRLTTLRCANVWPVEDAKFRWTDLRSDCDPENPLCDSAEAQVSKTLQASDCPSVRILKTLPEDHLARIRCERPAGAGPMADGSEMLINLDSLACHPRDSATRPDPEDEPGDDPGAGLSPALTDEGERVVALAEERMRSMRSSVARDTDVLLRHMRRTEPGRFAEAVGSATSELEELFREVQLKQSLDEDCEPTASSKSLNDDQVRAQRTCRLLGASAKAGRTLLASAREWASEMPGPDPGHWQDVALQKAAARRAASKEPYRQADALSVRMLLFYALRDGDPRLPARLKLIRRAVESGIGPFWELHAGFVFGGRRLQDNSGGYDCSDFLESLLADGEPVSGGFSTVRLKRIARHLLGESRGELPKGSRRLASCFSAVDLRAGALPRPGDFVISNNETLKDGHVAIVKQLVGPDAILTIEAAGGGANTIMSKTRPLREPPPQCLPSEQPPPFRPDLYVLRLKNPQPDSCPLRSRR